MSVWISGLRLEALLIELSSEVRAGFRNLRASKAMNSGNVLLEKKEQGLENWLCQAGCSAVLEGAHPAFPHSGLLLVVTVQATETARRVNLLGLGSRPRRRMDSHQQSSSLYCLSVSSFSFFPSELANFNCQFDTALNYLGRE